MNKQEADILNVLLNEQFVTQRILSELSGHSLGVVNRSIKNLMKEGFLDEHMRLTRKAKVEIEKNSPKNAIILAAGFGMRMVPVNSNTPKALMEVNGETLIERTIEQLHDVGINDIYIVVGYMKEKFEYLIDDYGVELIINEKYAEKNNLHSLFLASCYLSNTYIIPSDIWCDRNPYREKELYSWYMVSELVENESIIRVNRKMELVCSRQGGNQMVGITYLTEQQSDFVKKKLEVLDNNFEYDGAFWEEALIDGDRMIIKARVANASDVVEINTYEQLRELDEESNHLKSDAISVIADVLKVNPKEIIDISVMKKGMTNRSFVFRCKKKKYIMRVPGEGTDMLVDRSQEAIVYETIKGKGLCDDPIYINPKNGYKITEYIENVHVCDFQNENELKICMTKLRKFHNMNLKVEHKFDVFLQIEFYEALWKGESSIYRDYQETKKNVFSLKSYIEKNIKQYCLAHIDAVPDNFLFYDGGVQLTDWEYSGMQDPHIDIAMFAIYCLYDRRQTDNLINIYFGGICDKNIKLKIYCYMSVCGLLWSNWCEYKRRLGVEFGEYSLRQYRYAKDYYNIVMHEMEEFEDES